MRFLTFIFFSLFLLRPALSQDFNGLVSWISFDHCETVDDSENRNHAYFSSKPNCRCGVSGQALSFDGETDFLEFDSDLNTVLNAPNYSISFYFKPDLNFNYYSLFSRSELCQKNPFLEAWMLEETFTVFQQNRRYHRIEKQIEQTCWKHLVFVKNEFGIQVFVNGKLIAEHSRRKRIYFASEANLIFGASTCKQVNSLSNYKGLIDEIKIYNRALNPAEINSIFHNTYTNRMILNSPTELCSGEEIQIETQGICQEDIVQWTPVTGINDPTNPNPIIKAEYNEIYTLEVDDGSGQICLEQFEVKLRNPMQLNLGKQNLSLCKQDSLFINAYTPNGNYLWQDGSTEAQMLIKSAGRYWVQVEQDGCMLNDTIFVSDVLCENQICRFKFPERFNPEKDGFKASGCQPEKWLLKVYTLDGKLLFESKNFEEAWNGQFQNQDLNAGKYLWQLVYQNKEEPINSMKGFVELQMDN